MTKFNKKSLLFLLSMLFVSQGAIMANGFMHSLSYHFSQIMNNQSFQYLASQVVSAYVNVKISMKAQDYFLSSSASNNEVVVHDTNLKDCPGINIKEVDILIDQIKDPKKYEGIGIKPIKGILLVGLPGTGKTLLAKAIAGEVKCPFYSIKSSELENPMIGMSARGVRSLFADARKKASMCESKTAIIFIDEIDAIAGDRNNISGFSGMGNILSALLTEMSGFEEKKGIEDKTPLLTSWYRKAKSFLGWSHNAQDVNIVVLGATNCPDKIDPALNRAGRFDKQIEITYPDKTGREAIVAYYLKKFKHDETIDAMRIAELIDGASPSDINAIFEDAGRNAAYRLETKIEVFDFCNSILNREKIATSQEKDAVVKNLLIQGIRFNFATPAIYESTKNMTSKEFTTVLDKLSKCIEENEIETRTISLQQLAKAVAEVKVDRACNDIKICHALYCPQVNLTKDILESYMTEERLESVNIYDRGNLVSHFEQDRLKQQLAKEQVL